MARHHLVRRASPADLVDVTADICGLHAQVMSSAELSLLARIEGLDRDAVRDALWTHRTLVKLWAMRGTLHLLPARDLGMWLSALSTYRHPENPARAELGVLAGAVERALDGAVLTREQLAQRVEEITGSAVYAEWVRFSWGSYLKASSFRGVLCFGPGEGSNVRFTSPSTWISDGVTRMDFEDAMRTITRRYFNAYAPATAEDIARWWVGPPMPKRGGAMLALLGDELIEVDVEGLRARVLASDLGAMRACEEPDVARLLPAFDPWITAGPRRPPMLEPEHLARVYRPQGWVSPVILVNGRVIGVWKHTRAGRRLMVELAPFGEIPVGAKGSLETEAERVARFFRLELAVTWTS